MSLGWESAAPAERQTGGLDHLSGDFADRLGREEELLHGEWVRGRDGALCGRASIARYDPRACKRG